MNIHPDLIEEIPFTGRIPVQRRDKFVMGPLPIWYLQTVWTECRPTALPIALLLFYRKGLQARPRPITGSEMELFGIHRWSKTEALRDLEAARLITLQPRGRRLIPVLDLQTRKPTHTQQ